MRYLPHTPEDIATMLDAVGIETVDGLFANIPEACRRRDDIKLPDPLSEWELNDHMDNLAGDMAAAPEYKIFLGAGSYDHYIPATASYLAGRGEFVTAYTPYQPEVSQGTLQAIFEFQTLTARLLGMDVANASMYDGASALAEALLMAIRVTKRSTVAVSTLIHPLYRRVIETYLKPTGYKVVELPMNSDGRTDLDGLNGKDDLAAIALQSPNFFGCVEDLAAAAEEAHSRKALLVTGFTEPLAFGLLKDPGSQGADIACGEGQSLGVPRTYGGPSLGMFATRQKYVRNIPGRLVGQTTDLEGRRGFVLTLATREQHIRREKATSNICTNNSLCAMSSAIYMACLGGSGIRELARLNYDKTEYLKSELQRIGCEIPHSAPTFNEFVAKLPAGFSQTYEKLLSRKIIAGLPLERYYPEMADHYLLCVTETISKDDMDQLVAEISDSK